MRTRLLAVTILAVLTWCSGAAPAAAQVAPPDPSTLPIPHVAVDARGVFPRFKQDAAIATGIGVSTANLPTHGLGVVVGAHWYPMHLGIVTFGVGGELLMARAGRTLAATTEGGEPGPTVNVAFSSLSPQISFNFGKQNGWSYISGGVGRSTYNAEREDTPLPDPVGSKTINYGGGARWFAKKHLALSVDLRFYAINPTEASDGRPALPRMTLLMLSAGASFK